MKFRFPLEIKDDIMDWVDHISVLSSHRGDVYGCGVYCLGYQRPCTMYLNNYHQAEK